MKILVYYQQKNKRAEFQGARLRKTIKGALENISASYTTNPYSNVDVAHLISPDDTNIIDLLKEKNIPIVVSALYSEDEPGLRAIDVKRVNGHRHPYLRNKFLKFYNSADLVLVPTITVRDFLINSGVITPIKVCTPAISLSRFDLSREDEKQIFYRYFNENKEKKIVVAQGEYGGQMCGLSAFIKAAEKNPNASFYYFGYESGRHIPRQYRKEIKNAPKNVHFKNSINDDIYRSALLDASLFMIFSYQPVGCNAVQEAMAAKCQIISRKNAIFPEMIQDQKTAYLAEYSETLTSLVCDYLDGKLQPTIDNAYREVTKRNLKAFGEDLLSLYQLAINNKKGE